MILAEPLPTSYPVSEERPPPSYESVLNADFGDPVAPVVTTPPGPLPILEPTSSPVPPPPRPALLDVSPPYFERHSAPAIPQQQRRERPGRDSRRYPSSAAFPLRTTVSNLQLPSASTHPAPHVGQAGQAPSPSRRRRSNSEGPSRPNRRAKHAGTVPTSRRQSQIQCQNTNPDINSSISTRARARGRPPVTPTTPQELLDLAGFRKASFFCSNKKTVQLVQAHSLEFLTRLEGHTDADVILKTLEEACSLCNITLGSVLREGRVDGHSPLYWAVVKGLNDSIIQSLLRYAPGPMDDEMRQGAIIRADWKLYQRLRAWMGIPGRVRVDEVAGGKRFAVHLEGIDPQAGVEFVASGRMWRISFTPGFVSLALMSQSAATFVDAKFTDTTSRMALVSVLLRSAQQIQPPNRRGKYREISAPLPERKHPIQTARLDVSLSKPQEDSSCIIC